MSLSSARVPRKSKPNGFGDPHTQRRWPSTFISTFNPHLSKVILEQSSCFLLQSVSTKFCVPESNVSKRLHLGRQLAPSVHNHLSQVIVSWLTAKPHDLTKQTTEPTYSTGSLESATMDWGCLIRDATMQIAKRPQTGRAMLFQLFLTRKPNRHHRHQEANFSVFMPA